MRKIKIDKNGHMADNLGMELRTYRKRFKLTQEANRS